MRNMKYGASHLLSVHVESRITPKTNFDRSSNYFTTNLPNSGMTTNIDVRAMNSFFKWYQKIGQRKSMSSLLKEQ